MVTQYVVLAIPDGAEARQLVQDMHRYVSEPILTPSANNPIHAVYIAQGTDPPDLQQPVWAAAMQTSLDRLEANMAVTQEELDGVATNLSTLGTTLSDAETKLLSGIDELKRQNPQLDATALENAVAALGPVKDQIQSTVDALPQPTPPPAP